MPVPYLEVHLDMDEDGTFESGEEISSDVRSFSIQRGKEVSQQKAAAAVLDMTLNSLDHKYSPSNTSSPLYPFTLPGPACRVRMGYPYDSFTGSNGTSIDGLTPDVGSELGNWAMSGPGGLEILSNEMTINAIGAHYGVLDYGVANVIIAAKIHRPTITTWPYTQSLFVMRYSDTNNWVQLRLEQTTSASPVRLQMQNKVSGTTGSTPALIEDLTIWAEDDYANVTVLLKGDRMEAIIESGGSYQTGSSDAVDGDLYTNTKHGIGGPDYTTDSPNGGATWDDYGLHTQFLGRVDLVEPQTQDGDDIAVLRAYDDMERMGLNVLFTGTTDLIPASSGDIANRILTRADFTGPSFVDDGTDPITPAQVDTGNNEDGVPVTTGTVMGGNALSELYQIADDEVGFFHIDRHGAARFESSDHRLSNDHLIPQATWTDFDNASTAYFREPLSWDAGIERVENQIFYEYFRLSKVLSSTVWFLEPDDDPQFTTDKPHPNTANYFIVDIAAIGEDLAISSPKVPLPGTDYSVDENADGTGVDWLTPIMSESGTVTLTGSPNYEIDDTGRDWGSDSNTIDGISFSASNHVIVMQDASGNTAVGTVYTVVDIDGDGTRATVSTWPEEAASTPGYISADADFDETDTPITYDVYVVAAFVLDGFEGNYQFLRFFGDANMDNGTSGTLPYVTSAKIQADKLAASVPAAARAQDTDSQDSHGLRRIRHTTKHIRDWTTATDRAEKRLALRKDAREKVVCHMRASTRYNLFEMLFRDVSDRVAISYSDMGLDRDYFVENYRFTWTQNNIIEARWEVTRAAADATMHYRYDAASSTYGTATYSSPE